MAGEEAKAADSGPPIRINLGDGIEERSVEDSARPLLTTHQALDVDLN